MCLRIVTHGKHWCKQALICLMLISDQRNRGRNISNNPTLPPLGRNTLFPQFYPTIAFVIYRYITRTHRFTLWPRLALTRSFVRPHRLDALTNRSKQRRRVWNPTGSCFTVSLAHITFRYITVSLPHIILPVILFHFLLNIIIDPSTNLLPLLFYR